MSTNPSWARRITLGVVGAAAALGTTLVPAQAATTGTPALPANAPAAGALQVDPGAPHEVGAPIDRALVKARALTWVDQGVPYSMEAYHPDPQGRNYRTDCSGFVSMAFHLPDSLSTVTLPEHFTPIDKGDLRPGDIIGNLGPGSAGAAGHVVIFDGWVEGSNQTRFHSIEERGDAGAVSNERTFGDSYWNQQGYRYNQIAD
ncbi:hypothetical protein [uncultured Tessaracoccus sp.]|uniref:hypothetical protein n=1 Tax=uncultured Tessaracoccus sp. TaxID=905023 RepID=UPI0025CC2A9F|nr:hypothetical protein [uncultured Tessaracoccus sp.]